MNCQFEKYKNFFCGLPLYSLFTAQVELFCDFIWLLQVKKEENMDTELIKRFKTIRFSDLSDSFDSPVYREEDHTKTQVECSSDYDSGTTDSKSNVKDLSLDSCVYSSDNRCDTTSCSVDSDTPNDTSEPREKQVKEYTPEDISYWVCFGQFRKK